jgi:hypothetical protein
MSLQNLQGVLQKQVDSDKRITVSSTTLLTANLTPAPDFDTIIQKSLVVKGSLSVAVSGPIASPSDNHLTVDGTASFLGLTSIAVKLDFVLDEAHNTVDLLLSATLPADWTFAKSFPLLVGFPFADLALTNSNYFVTTAVSTSISWQQETLTLHQGLNLAAFLGMTGPLSLLQALIDTLDPQTTITFAGVINCNAVTDLAVAKPDLSLTGVINKPITAKTNFSLSLPEIHLSSALDENGLSTYWLTFASTLSAKNKAISVFEAAIPMPPSKTLSFLMLPAKGPITPEDIIELIGGEDFTKHIPPELQDVFSSVGLTELSARINTKTMRVLSIGAGIGTSKPWPMGQFRIESLVLKWLILSPFAGAGKTVLVNFTAKAEFFQKVFPGLFEFNIIFDDSSKQLVIAASYTGLVSLTNLLAGFSDQDNKISNPHQLDAIQFDTFGVTFTKAGSQYAYTLYGNANANFDILVAGKPIVASLRVKIDSAAKTYQLFGGLTLGNSYFQVEVDITATAKVLSAYWTALNDDYLELEAILKDLGFSDVPQIPKNLDLSLKSASITYDLTDEIFIMTAESVNYGKAVFVATQVNKTWEFFFLVEVDKKFSLSNLPLVGQELARLENIEVGKFEVIVGSIASTQDIADKVNPLINKLPDGPYPNLPAPDAGKPIGKFILMAEVDFGNQPPIPIVISLGAQMKQPLLLAATNGDSGGEVTQTTTPDGTTWLDVQKSFGPVSIQRIGVLYQSSSQSLWFELDATLAFGPLSLNLVGLGIGTPLKDFAPEFSLRGLGIAYDEPPLKIAGELVNLIPPGGKGLRFEGGVVISTGEFTVQAFGYYGNTSGFSSMFIFGDIAYDFGGPPAFFVTGLALGFGYNSHVTIPTIDEVEKFPFIQVLPTSTAPDPNLLGGPNASPLTVLNKILDPGLHQPAWVEEKQGSLWFAAGITFTSFELVNSQALLMVDAGSELVIALVGTSHAQFPQAGGEIVYANIDLDLLVRFAPSEGVFSLQAVLASSSFLLDKACVLTGGFAFFVWFDVPGKPDAPGSKHKDDFVLTLGGYHPAFTPPDYYPKVAPVGFHWTMDSTITIQGGAYFALTPAALMVGGSLKATYQSGHIKAWFDAHADVIIRWKPFWFDADIGITIGASYTIDWGFTTSTITVQVGCELEFWGPPTGGTVTIDLWIISITIPFGTPKNDTQRVKGWADVEQMLPNTGSDSAVNVLKLSPATGLIPNGTAPLKTEDDAWIVRGTMFSFSTSSSIPASTATMGGAHFTGDKFNVYPLAKLDSKWNGVSSELGVKIYELKDKKDFASSFEAVDVQGSVPAAVWGAPPEDDNGRPQVPDGKKLVVPNQLTGLSVQVKAPQVGNSAGYIEVQTNLKFDELDLPSAVLPLSSKAGATGDIPANSATTVSTIVAGIASSTARDTIFNALRAAGYAPDTNDPMTRFRDQLGCALNAEPLLVK